MTLNMDAVFNKMGQATQEVEDNIASFMDSMDPSNTTDVLKLQQMMQKWTIATQLETNVVKTIGDGIKSTVQNIR